MRDEAFSQILGALVSLGIMVPMVAVVLVESAPQTVNVHPVDGAILESSADGVVGLLLGSRGSADDWIDDPDGGGRLGLLGGNGAVSFAKLENLRRAPQDAADDGYLNYDEAKAGLELDLDFHVRAHPRLPGVSSGSAKLDPHLRVAYIGDAYGDSQEKKTGGSLDLGPIVCTGVGTAWNFSMWVQNTGVTTTQLHGTLTIYSREESAQPEVSGAPPQADVWAVDDDPGMLWRYNLWDVPRQEGQISNISGDANHEALAMAADGRLWMIQNAQTSKLWKLPYDALDGDPKTTVPATLVADTGLKGKHRIGAMEWINGTLYGISMGKQGLYRLDETGATHILDIDENGGFTIDGLVEVNGEVYVTETATHDTDLWKFVSFPGDTLTHVAELTGSGKVEAVTGFDNYLIYADDAAWWRINLDDHAILQLALEAADFEGMTIVPGAVAADHTDEAEPEAAADETTQGTPRMSTLTNGPLLAPGDEGLFEVSLPASGAWCGEGVDASWAVYDPNVAIETLEHGLSMPATDATADDDLVVDTYTPWTRPGETVFIELDSTTLANSTTVQVVVANATTEWWTNVTLGEPGNRTHELGAWPTGSYRINVSASDVWATELLVVSPDPDAFQADTASPGFTWADAARTEVTMLDGLAKRFCPYNHDDATTSPMEDPPAHATRCTQLHAALDGSVFPDLKKTMNEDLTGHLMNGDTARFDRFNVLVVGTGVDHNSMTSAKAKHAIRDWVYGGGTLIVFGSVEQGVNWLQPIFQAKIRASSGGISVPDVEHPVLGTPNKLAWEDYDNHGRAWDVLGAEESFAAVVQEGDDIVLGVSDPGAFGDGNVVLTSWTPYEPFEGAPDSEGALLMQNVLVMAYRAIYLDYGPELPPGQPVASASQIRVVDHPQLGQVPVEFQVYVFDRG